ncbi:hypothetical protein [Williamsia sp. D3]|uniref:hypothetical protein n=1 Tax=Williamsia sp. D3 TaxID=1313067 RepID=UPI0003FC685A|nr:hypothetical protein [Williamsia sp. D3]PZU02676.1 MAG: hypothetical protein DI630_07330 [Gordonia sp. (in: high G+C Gram-positive bacteria)]
MALVAGLIGCGSSEDTPATNSSGSQVQVAPAAPPTELRWVQFAGMTIPQAAEGPTSNPQALAPTGYAHNGPGAALAAISSTIRMSVADDDQWALIAGALAAPGPGRDAWSIERSQISITSDVPAGQAPTVLGYTVTEYTPERAVIAIITRQPDQSLTSTTTTVVWTPPGDWRRLIPDPQTSTANPVAVLDSVPPQMIPLPA